MKKIMILLLTLISLAPAFANPNVIERHDDWPYAWYPYGGHSQRAIFFVSNPDGSIRQICHYGIAVPC